MSICLNEIILTDDKIKAQHLYTFLQLINISEDGIVTISMRDLMSLVKCKDKETVLKYIDILIEAGYIEKLNPINRKSTYKLNRQYYYK